MGKIISKSIENIKLCFSLSFVIMLTVGLLLYSNIFKTYKEVADTDVKERRVATDRCAYLIAVTLANKLEEVWISLQPVLLLAYACQYTPVISRR